MHGLPKNKSNQRFKAAAIALFATAVLFSSSAWPQRVPEPVEDTGVDSSDLVFRQILLTPFGVQAADTAGNPWNYDFQNEVFQPAVGRLSDGWGRGEGRSEGSFSDLPVEERCLVERHIRPSEHHIVVDQEEFVDGNIVTSGRVTVRGWVQGNIRSYKKVTVSESGQVDGNISAPIIVLKDGSVVSGTVEESSIFDGLSDDFINYSASSDGIWVLASFAALFLLSGFLILTLVPTKMERVSVCLINNPVRCFLLGFLFTFLMPMVIVLVAITIVGLFVVWLVPLAYLLAYMLGIISSCTHLGQKLVEHFTGHSRSSTTNYLAGLMVYLAPWLLTAMLMGSGDSAANGFGIFFMVISILITTGLASAGAGATMLTRFGYRNYVSFKQQTQPLSPQTTAPAPPPIPAKPSGLDPPDSLPDSGPGQVRPPGPGSPVMPPPLTNTKDGPLPPQEAREPDSE